MVSPINLNKARKERARTRKKAQSEENALRFGRTKAEKEASRSEAEKTARALDAHKRET
ncbi:DUF4169 family protein [uncultured Roseobacter sp.]|uniref:DUF4169 family protein n=1 Tax=uncultured Roseobacter sp. TaxID=114847 RepID=UPI0026171F86|nr:DUF4169 family protein [uncultured Roseobacter sp.]